MIKHSVSKGWFYWWITYFVIGMVIFTFLDLPIAKSLYHYSDTYGRIFEVVGLIPTCICGIFFSMSNLCTLSIARNKPVSIIISIFAFVLYIGFTLLSLYYVSPRFFIPVGVFSIVFIPVSYFLNRAICRKIDLYEVRKVMLIALFATFMAVIGQMLAKYCFNRPRYYLLSDPDTEFRYWFYHYPFALDSSFPSGHAAQAALTYMILYLKRFIPSLDTKKWDAILFLIATFLTVSTMLSRMFLGMHYATDVWAGSFLTLGMITWADWYFERSYTKS